MMTLRKGAVARTRRAKGETWEAMAKRYGCSPDLVRASAAQAQRRQRLRELLQNERNDVRRLAAAGETPSNIAAAFGMRLAAVQQILKATGEK